MLYLARTGKRQIDDFTYYCTPRACGRVKWALVCAELSSSHHLFKLIVVHFTTSLPSHKQKPGSILPACRGIGMNRSGLEDRQALNSGNSRLICPPIVRHIIITLPSPRQLIEKYKREVDTITRWRTTASMQSNDPAPWCSSQMREPRCPGVRPATLARCPPLPRPFTRFAPPETMCTFAWLENYAFLTFVARAAGKLCQIGFRERVRSSGKPGVHKR